MDEGVSDRDHGKETGSARHSARPRQHRSVSTLFATLLLLGVPIFVANAAKDDRRVGHSERAQDLVEDLVVCYARGTDALGRAVSAIGDQPLDSTVNLSDPDFAEGLRWYRKCFDRNFSFTLMVDGVPTVTVPDPATRTPETDAALQWANFVNNAFRGPGYRNTQHHMGSISSKVHGNRADVQSYLIATHAFGPTSENTGVNVVGGTYYDEAVRRNGRWLIEQRTLDITSSVLIPAEP